jgi:hypothetical protein
MLDNAISIAEEAQFVPLTEEQVAEAKAKFETASGGTSP